MNYKSLSIVVPCHNEEEVIPESYSTLRKIVSKIKRIEKYQFVFVNNGSDDDTLNVLLNLKEIISNF